MTHPKEVRPVGTLRLGDYVDLEGDPVADYHRDKVAFEEEYQIITALELKSPERVGIEIQVGGEHYWFEFPPGHLIRVVS